MRFVPTNLSIKITLSHKTSVILRRAQPDTEKMQEDQYVECQTTFSAWIIRILNILIIHPKITFLLSEDAGKIVSTLSAKKILLERLCFYIIRNQGNIEGTQYK